MDHRLYRSRTDRMWAGVCGGLAQYFGVDATLIRLAFVAFTLAGGAGLLIYIVMCIVVPENPNEFPTTTGTSLATSDQPGESDSPQRLGEGAPLEPTSSDRTRNAVLLGGIFIVAGAYLILRNLGFPLFAWINGDILWPLVLIIGGIFLLWRYLKQQ